MMQILRDQYDSELTNLDMEIQSWPAKYAAQTSSTSFADKENRLKEHLVKYTTDLIKLKEGI